MRSIKVLFVFILLLLTSGTHTFAQATLSDKAFISLLTCGPGEELYSVFGHTAIRVNDPAKGIDIVYNYGTFDFDAPNFYLKFVKGDLQYFVSVSSYRDFVYTYEYYNRDVFEQVLNLTPKQEQIINNELNDVLNSDRKFYTYKFIGRNCTTMAGDVIALGIGKPISEENSDKGKTYRKIIYEYLHNHILENLGISLTFGAKTDRVMDEPFLPAQLLEGIEKTRTENGPLAQPVITVNKSLGHSGEKSNFHYYLFIAFVIALLYFSDRRAVYVPVLIVGALMGIFFCAAHFYSFHDEITLNYNALLLNPLFLPLLIFIYRDNIKATVYTLYVCLALLIVYVIIIVSKPHLPLVLPIIALIGTILTRLLLRVKQTNSLKIT